MTLNEYQGAALATATYKDKIVYPILGMNGEAGEVADKYKKILRDNDGVITEEHRQGLLMEAGDVLWYVATLAYDLGASLEEVAQVNVEKLRSRKERDMLSGSGDNR